jgi:glyoxylase-like metal-dependent hydrolase (beta-lactamase superfamily II)
MWNKLIFAVVFIAFTSAGVQAQEAKNELGRIAETMGATNLKTIQYTGNGANYSLGQNFHPIAPWPRFHVKSFNRTVNYETGSMRDELVRTQGEIPPRGLVVEQRQVLLVSGAHAWNQVGENSLPRVWETAERSHHLWITPHGVIKRAIANKAMVKTQTRGGRKVTTVSFVDKGKFKVNAFVNDQNLVESVESWFGNPVLGDLMVETRYADYRDFGGVKFPAKIVQITGGFPSLDLTVSDVRPNVSVDIQVPDNVRQKPVEVKTEKVTDGVWYITGGSHHSVALEMKDHVIVVEGPQGEERSEAVIAEVKKALPGKPIRYLINTHHHFDHSGGIRTYAAEGATIITHEINKAYFEWAAATPRTLNPDRLAKLGKKMMIQPVAGKFILDDGTRTVQIFHMEGNTHNDGLIMAYLPKEKLLIEADAYTPGPPNTPAPKVPNPFSVNLNDNIGRLNLEIDKILPLHGHIVPLSELFKAIGKAPSN